MFLPSEIIFTSACSQPLWQSLARPTATWSKALIAAGVKRVVVCTDYHSTLATEFFAKAKTTIDRIPMPSKQIVYDLEKYTSARKAA